MGGVLAAPITVKESGDEASESKGLVWGHSCMQGWRVQMEDAHFAIHTLQGEGWTDTAAFAVMDGHGGKEVALFCEEQLPRAICMGKSSDAHGALINAFHHMDEMLDDDEQSADALRRLSGITGFSGPPVNPEWVGCTCVVCLVRPDVLVVANAGDSRAVLSRGRQAVPLSEDHKPNLPTEKHRIQRAGGSVERRQAGQIVQFRVNGNLNLSRSIGDLEYKRNTDLLPSEQMICATPDVQTFKRDPSDEFMILACDGIWDRLGNQEAVDFVHERLADWRAARRLLSSIMEELLDRCLSPDLSLTNGLGGDNMTALLVVFEGSSATAPVVTPRRKLTSDVSLSIKPLAAVEERAIHTKWLCSCKPDLHI